MCVLYIIGGLHLTGCQPSQSEAALPIVSPVLRHQSCLSASRLPSSRVATRSISPRQVAVGLSKNTRPSAGIAYALKCHLRLFSAPDKSGATRAGNRDPVRRTRKERLSECTPVNRLEEKSEIIPHKHWAPALLAGFNVRHWWYFPR
jgi:hypothetical protein